MRHLCTLLLMVAATFLSAQPEFLYNRNFSILDLIPCPYDSTKIVSQPRGWFIYQTLDDTWNGPIDSARCIDVVMATNGAIYIPLSQLNPEHPLYIRANTAEYPPTQGFLKNWAYRGESCFHTSPGNVLKSGADCTEELCTGLFIGIGIPDENGTPNAAMRFQQGLFNPNAIWANCNGVTTCFPTEKFDNQTLREFILKFSFENNADLNNKNLFLNGSMISYSEITVGISELTATQPPITPGVYSMNISEGNGYATTYLLQYTADTYPSAANPSWVDATPSPNLNVPAAVLVNVNEYQNLEVQPFTYLRGGLIDGSNTLRHTAVLVNLGADFCMNNVDLIFDDSTVYRHVAGTISMNNAFSCMQFRNKSALEIAEGTHLHYGNEGAGMLALCYGGTIRLERNATLSIDARLNLSECNDHVGSQQIYMDLPPGSRLEFTENARLINQYSHNQGMYLNIRMLGGIIDDARLPAADRALIRRIYPEPAPSFADNIRLWPMPVSADTRLEYLSKQENEALRIRWIDAAGRMVLEQSFTCAKGTNEWPLNTPTAYGWYAVEVSTNNGYAILKAIKN